MKLLRFFILPLVFSLVLITFCAWSANSLAATLTVTKTADTNDGVCNSDCSLREAISKTVAGDAVAFNIPTTDAGCSAGVCTISPTSSLPGLSKGNVTIDGFTQTGTVANSTDFPNAMNPALKIVLNGTGTTSTINGLTVSSNNNTIRGLVIKSFTRYGISLSGNNNRVQGCIVGLDVTGEIAAANTSAGVYITTSTSQQNIIGTDGDGINDATERNIISKNGAGGVYINAGLGQNVIAGNFIGTDKDGTTDLGNTTYGIYIRSGVNQNVIGTNGNGTYDASEGNLISGNSSNGIYTSANSDIIAGNLLGTDATGTARIRNDSSAIILVGSNTRVGTNGDGVSDEWERNIISGSSATSQRGILGSGSNVTVAGNFIGTDVTGTLALNNNIGIQLTTTARGWIIGTNGDGIGDEFEGNLIASNATNLYLEGSNHVVTGNIIGTDINTTAALGTSGYGVRIYSGTNDRIGTNGDGVSDELEGNIISGSTGYGIIFENGASNMVVAGNLLGTNETGLSKIANNVAINLGSYNGATAASSVRIGTNGDGVSDTAERNVISGNSRGIQFTNASANIIAGNYIGVGSDGTTALGNTSYGIIFAYSGATNSIFGGETEAEGNIIANNGDSVSRYGMYLAGATADGNQILRNSFFNNFGLGIKLKGDGANNNIAAPVLTGQSRSGDDLILTGTAVANTTIQLFLANEDFEEGQTFVSELIANADGQWTHTLTEHKAVGTAFVATATTAVDGTSQFSTAYTIINEQPTADTQSTSINEDSQQTITLSGSDANSDVLSFSITTLPASGRLYQTADGTTPGDLIATVPTIVTDSSHRLIYIPDTNTNGSGIGSFGFKTNDGSTDSIEATVTIDVAGIQDSPTTSMTVTTTNEDTNISFTLPASDVDGDALTFSIVTEPAHGTITAINASTGIVTYAPAENFNGTDSFTFRVNDGTEFSNSAEALITINAMNDAPVASPISGTTNENAPVTLQLVGSDIDAGDTLTYSLVNFPTHGSLASFDSQTGRLTYLPTTDFSGADSFSYHVSDGSAHSNTATVAVSITALPVEPGDDETDTSAPIVDAGLSRHEVVGTVITLKGKASDADGDPLTYQWSQTEGAAVTLSDADQLTASFVAPEELAGQTLTFTLTADDGSKTAQDSARITLLAHNRTTEKTVLISQRLVDIDKNGNRIVENADQITLWNSCSVFTCTENAAEILVIDSSHVAIGDPYCNNNQGTVVVLDKNNLDCSTDVDLNALDSTTRPGLLVAQSSDEGSYFGASLKLGDLNGDKTQELYVAAPGTNFGTLYGLELSTLQTQQLIAGSENRQLKSSLMAFANIDGISGTEAFIGLAPDSTADWDENGPLTGIVSGVSSTFDVISATSDLPDDIDFSYTGADYNVTTSDTITQIMTGQANVDPVEDVAFGSASSCSFEFLFGQSAAITDDINLTGNTAVTCSESSAFEHALLVDVSGDGYSDLVVGFPNENGGNGLIAVLPGPFESDETSYSLDDAVLIFGNSDERLGERLFAGDYGNDGVMDIFTSSFTDGEDKTKAIVFSNANAQSIVEPDAPDSESGENGSDLSGLSAAGAGCALLPLFASSAANYLLLVFFIPLLILRVLATIKN